LFPCFDVGQNVYIGQIGIAHVIIMRRSERYIRNCDNCLNAVGYTRFH